MHTLEQPVPWGHGAMPLKTPSTACVFSVSSLGLQGDLSWHWFVVWTQSQDGQIRQTPPPLRGSLSGPPFSAGLRRLACARDLPGKWRSSRQHHSGTPARQGFAAALGPGGAGLCQRASSKACSAAGTLLTCGDTRLSAGSPGMP